MAGGGEGTEGGEVGYFDVAWEEGAEPDVGAEFWGEGGEVGEY